MAATPGKSPAAAHAKGFRLVRYFTLASLGAFLLVGAALVFQDYRKDAFFQRVQKSEGEFFAQVQDGFVKQQLEQAKKDLLAIHESGNVNLTRLFANALWDKDFAPFVAKVAAMPVDQCRAIADVTQNGKAVAPPEKKACYSALGARIMALPEFRAIDAKVHESMRKSSVFKIKVFDLRGITAYSSEHAQIGEDKAFNAGWKAAAAGRTASELTHRDKFSAFEGVVENRDLISSYLPVLGIGTDRIVGVFEIYSDVTPLLEQITRTNKQTAAVAAANMARVNKVAAANAAEAKQESLVGLGVVCLLLAGLFAILYLVVRRADRIIASQAHEREIMQQQLGQSEKMSALGQMVAGVAHQLNTPLAFSQSNVNLVIDRLGDLDAPVRVASRLTQLVRSTEKDTVVLNMGRSRDQVAAIDASPQDLETMREMLQDVLRGIGQMSELVVHMREFTRLDRAALDDVDINQGLKTVAYMARSVIPNEIRLVEEYGALPKINCNPSQLNQVFLNLITNGAQAIEGTGMITVRTSADKEWVRVEVSDTGSGIPPDVLPHIFDSFYTTKPRGVGTGLGLSIAMEIVREHGGEIQVDTAVGRGTTFTILLPVQVAEMRLAA